MPRQSGIGFNRWFGTAAAAVLASLVVGPAGAQVGNLIGSADGSYCKVRSGNRIEVDSWLSPNASPDMLQNMTLRRIASLSRSQGFEGFLVASDARCGIMKQGQRDIARRCKVHAVAANAPGPDAPLPQGKTWLSNAEIFAGTDAEAASYPVRTGLLSRGSACIID